MSRELEEARSGVVLVNALNGAYPDADALVSDVRGVLG